MVVGVALLIGSVIVLITPRLSCVGVLTGRLLAQRLHSWACRCLPPTLSAFRRVARCWAFHLQVVLVRGPLELFLKIQRHIDEVLRFILAPF